MNFFKGINGELLKASASECKSFLYFLKILKKKTSRIWGRGGRIHTLYSTPFARLVVKSEGWEGGRGGVVILQSIINSLRYT